jgi:transcriptional regulator with XRE-family HTH domain
MRSSRQSRSAHSAGHAHGHGAIVRGARTSQGLTLAELGARVGYSAAQVSRYERGIAPLTDITVLRRFAAVLGIPPQLFGLSPAGADDAGRHAVIPVKDRPGCAHGNTVYHERQWEDGDEEDMRRRELLAGTAALAGAVALGSVRRRTPGPTAGLEDVLYGRVEATPVSLAGLRDSIASARDDFRAARYDRLPATLPQLIATARATSDSAGSSEQADASTLLAGAFILAADFAVKLNDDPLAWMTADRALQAAQAGNDPLILADARRAVATAMRRAGHPDRACSLLVRACRDIDFGRHGPDQLAMYGTLLNVAAYTAATAGNRRAAAEYIEEAAAAATRLGPRTSRHQPAFGPAGVTLYQVSIAQVLGDNGTAIEHARKLRPASIPTAERQGRYWVDVARAYHQWGKPEACYAALVAAERAAPAEVRYRPPVHRMTEDLLRTGPQRSMPGLRAFAARTGLPGT